jgi:hypothetical protein
MSCRWDFGTSCGYGPTISVPPTNSPQKRRCFAIVPGKIGYDATVIGFGTMRNNSRLFRLPATVALAALLWDAVLPYPAVAQPAPPPLPAPGGGRPDLTQGDPPERVGRIARMAGTVSFHNLGDTQWSAATLNYPVSGGSAFWTEPSSEARLEVSASRIAMGGGTEFDVAMLDATGLQGVAAQGVIYLHLRGLASSEVWSVQTPRGLVRLNGDGRYEITVGTTDQPTLVTVVDGAAQIDSPGVSLKVVANQTATITGTDSFQASLGPALQDTFLTAQLDAERPLPPPAVPVPAAVVTMAGGSDLVASGNWSEAPDYGQVWYPPVSANWVPYREGHWAYVAPWGWTWVDDAPWGFAPFHYGRWLQIGGRWAWAPGTSAVNQRPVYAPALVTFIGVGAGVALGTALATGSIGWVPLGPREQFHPWYHASNNYVRQVNVSHVTNFDNRVTINNYVNRAAATSIPATAMTGSRPVQAVARPVSVQEFAAARPISGQQPIRPTAATAGVTPVVARQLNLVPMPGTRPAPGPTVRAQAGGGAGFAKPALNGIPSAPSAIQPGSPSAIAPGVQPVGPITQEHGRAATLPPIPPRPGERGAVRPEAVPGPPRSVQTTPQLAPPSVPLPSAPSAPQSTTRPTPPTSPTPPHSELQRIPPAIPHQEPQHVAPLAPRPEPPHIAPVAPSPEAPPHMAPAAPHPEPLHMPPAAPHPTPQQINPVAPHPEPQHIAPVAPRAEQQHFAPVAPRPESPHAAPVPPPRAAPPPPRPEVRPAAPAHPETQQRKPGEH